ncbi:hypothetical protein SLS62_008009 [Diatrype stigma]|uniref:D-xylose 1-dehydrogenase (NADP(+), D-xylono-1,5-lactone-forming) n=1 Tax=Diatrype stigma TaxID=117547 RepID=A0AAN9YPS4_9PEZI
MALITPAKSHPEVIIHAVAARDKTRATAFSRKHGIPVVKNSYDEILDDPAIDAVYIPLPNGLHFEWTLKALSKGKHVLLEKPSTNNAEEADILFHHRLLFPSTTGKKTPVLMEAFHPRFTPAWRQFMAVLDPPSISHVVARAMIPSFFIPRDDDIRFDYSLGGGSLLDVGTYTVVALRDAFGTEPTKCIEARLTPMAPPRERCDHTFHAKLRFPNGGVGEVDGSLRAPNTRLSLPTITVTHKPVAAPEEQEAGAGEEVTRTRRVVFHNFMFSPHYHRIDVEDKFEVTKKGEEGTSTVVREFTRTESKKAYTFREVASWPSDQPPGEPHWSTYRYMLEQFVNRIKGREGSGIFISHEDSVAQARALDMIYGKSGLGLRPTCEKLSEFV